MVWAVIAGSAPLALSHAFEQRESPVSAYGPLVVPLRHGRIGGQQVVVLARHGQPHRIAPHLIDYRANIDTLSLLGVRGVVALNTVGGITPGAPAGSLHVPHQIIDYTWGRAHTFCDEATLLHTDFAEPLDADLRRGLLAAAVAADVPVVDGAVYGCTQGPRFETAAEIERMARDGCDLVGMTGMPEAALARERGLPYAMLSLVVNPAAGRAANPFDLAAIAQVAEAGMVLVERLLDAFFRRERVEG
jgi:5'-methylthioinosine phosphorylase